jgi:peptide/bleomycin uptake transporter
LQKPPETAGLEKFYERLIFFLYLAIPYVTTFSFTNWFTRMWTFRWREAITFSYMPYWRAVDAKVEGASQRIQEDCRDFANIVENIGLDIVRAVMTLIAFLPILWSLSENVVAPYLENFSGSLVWVALLVSVGGLTISWFVGIKLPGLEYNNQKAEAAFRKELVDGEDDRKNYAQDPTVLQLFTGIKFNYHRLFLHYGYFDLWSILYRQIFVIVPFVIMGPGLFTGAYTLGVMMRAVNAFGEIKDAFNVFLYNWVQINKLRSIHKRLSEFELAINFKNKLRKPSKSDVRA